jgi:hypothetical protein
MMKYFHYFMLTRSQTFFGHGLSIACGPLDNAVPCQCEALKQTRSLFSLQSTDKFKIKFSRNDSRPLLKTFGTSFFSVYIPSFRGKS